MNFTAAQLDLLRDGLSAYRVLNAVNNDRPPWKTVTARIEKFRVQSLDQTRTAVSPLAEEALRRFAEGLSVLKDANRLVDIQRFLIAAGVVSASDFSGLHDVAVEAMGVHAKLANTSAAAQARIGELAPLYRGRSNNAAREEQIELRLFQRPPLTWFHVEELTLTRSDEGRIIGTKDTGSGILQKTIATKHAVRRGYGFLSTRERKICIYLRGGSELDRVQYVEVVTPLEQNDGDIFFIGVGNCLQTVWREEPVATMVKACNILRFVPAGSAEN